MNKIKTLRKLQKLPQWRFAKQLGVTQSALSHYERGRLPPIQVAYMLLGIAEKVGLKITLEDIYPPDAYK